MPKQRNAEKKKAQEKQLGDNELLSIFLLGKKKSLQSPNLKLAIGLNGGLNLLVKFNEKWQVYCTRAKLKDGIGRERAILVIDPSIGTNRLLQVTFSGFDPTAIYWVKGLVPLNWEKALSIYTEATSPLLRMEAE